MQIPMATDDVGVLQRLATQLFGHFHIGSPVMFLLTILISCNFVFTVLVYLLLTRTFWDSSRVMNGVFSNFV